jgi:hypothetical protein
MKRFIAVVIPSCSQVSAASAAVASAGVSSARSAALKGPSTQFT